MNSAIKINAVLVAHHEHVAKSTSRENTAIDTAGQHIVQWSTSVVIVRFNQYMFFMKKTNL